MFQFLYICYIDDSWIIHGQYMNNTIIILYIILLYIILYMFFNTHVCLCFGLTVSIDQCFTSINRFVDYVLNIN